MSHPVLTFRWDMRPSTLSAGQRIDRVLLRLQLAAQGKAIAYDLDFVRSSPVEKSSAPPDVDLIADAYMFVALQLAERLEALAAGERDSLVMTLGELRATVRLFPGYSSGFLAAGLGETLERVAAARAALGVDSETGLQKAKALTAAAPSQFESDATSAPDQWAFETWDVYTPEAVYGVELNADDAPEHGGWSALEGAGVSNRRYYENRTAPGRLKDVTSPLVTPFDGDPAGEWLRDHDPRQCAEGVAREIESALDAEALSLEEARGAFRKTGGRPSAELAHLRARIAAALAPLWEDDGRRDLMASALACDRTTLWRLMSKPQHVSAK